MQCSFQLQKEAGTICVEYCGFTAELFHSKENFSKKNKRITMVKLKKRSSEQQFRIIIGNNNQSIYVSFGAQHLAKAGFLAVGRSLAIF